MTIYQRPNVLQLVAIAATALAFVWRPTEIVAVIAWSAFGWDELRYGDGPFRRTLGAVVLSVVAVWLGWQLWLH